jgi:hypothetical protein
VRVRATCRAAALAAIVLVSFGASALGGTPKRTVKPVDVQPRLPVRATIYYPWFPEGWTSAGVFPQTKYHPTLGYYDLDDPAIVRAQLRAMTYAHIDVGLSSWIGQGNVTDRRFARILALTGGRFRWAVYYEPEGYGDPTPEQIRADLRYIKQRYGGKKRYFRIRHRFVVFVFNADNKSCDVASRWQQANSVGAYVVLQVFPGYRSCADQPDGWHEYGGGPNGVNESPYSFTIMPGFFKRSAAAPLFARDPARWATNIADMVKSRARFQIVTSFNEWFEGTAVESAAEWASPSGYGTYLDALHAVPTRRSR